jgi:excisionase family DNA binding protein
MSTLTSPAHRGEFLTVAGAAEELHCSEPTIRRRIRDGDLPAAKLGAGRNSGVRIPREALTTWL